jgi:hypothetical protein
MATQTKTIRSVWEDSKKSTWPLGLILFKSARDVVACARENSGIMPPVETLSPNDQASRIIMGSALSLVTKGAWAEAGFTEEKFIEDFNSGIFDFSLPMFAASFLRQFPTLQAAVKKFDKPINMSGHSTDTLAAVEQLLNLTVEEAGLLVSAKPLVMQFKESLLAQGAQPIETSTAAETRADNEPQVISIPDERIAKIRSMFSGGKSPSDIKIATELSVSESLAKKLRLQAGIKRRERKKSMS